MDLHPSGKYKKVSIDRTPMSTPTRELENLNLGGDMHRGNPNRVLGQQRRRARERAEDQQRQQQAQRYPALAPAPAPVPSSRPSLAPSSGGASVQGSSGVHYRIRDLTPGMSQAAEDSLSSRDKFLVEYSRSHDDGEASYVAFQLGGGVDSVRIYSPSSGRGVKCGCNAFRLSEPPATCAHIYWLYDRLNETFPLPATPGPLPTDRESIERRIVQLYDVIDQDIENMPIRFGQSLWIDQTDDRDDEDELTALDVLGFLDANRVYGETDELPPSPSVAPLDFQGLAIPGDMAATVVNLFQHDRLFRARLSNAITKDKCAADLVAKMNDRAQRILKRFDEYADDETAFRPTFVPECADRLRGILNRLAEYNTEKLPLNSAFHKPAAVLAARLLEAVCERDQDIYHETPRPGRAVSPLAERDRNLFANLIRAPRQAQVLTDFVLDFLLEEIPVADRSTAARRLQALVEPLCRRRAPATYVEKLQRILQTTAGGPATESESAGEGPSRTPARTAPVVPMGRTVPARRAPSFDLGQTRQQKRQQK